MAHTRKMMVEMEGNGYEKITFIKHQYGHLIEANREDKTLMAEFEMIDFYDPSVDPIEQLNELEDFEIFSNICELWYVKAIKRGMLKEQYPTI